jgi:hypothetical protein
MEYGSRSRQDKSEARLVDSEVLSCDTEIYWVLQGQKCRISIQ